MKTIIAGSRHFTDYEFLCERLAEVPWEITEVVSGCAEGADTLGERWGDAKRIKVTRFPAEWERLGRAAGPVRNGQMAAYAQAFVAFLYPNSRGTANMIKQATKKGLRMHVVYCTSTYLWDD